MTFGAMAAWQAWLLLAAAGAAAAAVFLIRLRAPRVPIASLVLWRRVLDDTRELTLWERIRRAVSLAIAVAIAVAVALALTRPAPRAVQARAAGPQLVVLDSSWSMQAETTGGGTRLDRGRAVARRLVAAAGGQEVAIATTADGVIEGPTADAAPLEAAIDAVVPGGAADAPWPVLPGAAGVHFITDGAGERPLDPGVQVHPVFEPAGNVAVTAFAVRPSLEPGAAAEAYLEITNFAPAAQRVRLTLSRGAVALFSRDLDAAPGAVLRQAVPLPRDGGPVLTARVAAPINALAADDRAVVWVPGLAPLEVVVVGEDTGWLRPAIAAHAGATARYLQPADYTGVPEADPGARVFIFDRWAPAAPPRAPALLVAPPPATPWLAGAVAAEPALQELNPVWSVPGQHPIVAGVDPSTLTIARARRYGAPTLEPVAVSAGGTALVSVHASPEHRYGVVAFGPHDSNLRQAPGFPVLVGNAIDWLSRPSVTRAAAAQEAGGVPGRGAAWPPGLVVFDRSVTRVAGPEGDAIGITRMDGRPLALLRAPGLYTYEGAGARGALAVHVGGPAVSDLTRSALPARPAAAGSPGPGPTRPWWIVCVAAAFALALGEWWTWHRRITV